MGGVGSEGIEVGIVFVTVGARSTASEVGRSVPACVARGRCRTVMARGETVVTKARLRRGKALEELPD